MRVREQALSGGGASAAVAGVSRSCAVGTEPRPLKANSGLCICSEFFWTLIVDVKLFLQLWLCRVVRMHVMQIMEGIGSVERLPSAIGKIR